MGEILASVTYFVVCLFACLFGVCLGIAVEGCYPIFQVVTCWYFSFTVCGYFPWCVVYQQSVYLGHVLQ